MFVIVLIILLCFKALLILLLFLYDKTHSSRSAMKIYSIALGTSLQVYHFCI